MIGDLILAVAVSLTALPALAADRAAGKARRTLFGAQKEVLS